MNTNGQIRVLDPFAMEELDSIDVNNLQMVFQAHFLNPKSNRQEYSFYNSFRCIDFELYMLGLKQLQTVRVLNWSDRLTALTDASLWLDALALSVDFHDGCAKAVIGLPRNSKSLRLVLGKRMTELLYQYIDATVAGTTSVGDDDLQQLDKFSKLAAVCVDFCVTIDRIDLLFGVVFERWG